MTVQELYENIGASYESVKRILPSDRLVSKFVLKFLDDKSCQRLMDGRDNQDPSAMFEGAHALKGVCANLGMNELSQAASAIAEEFRPGKTPVMTQEELDRRLGEIRERYARTVEGIRQFAQAQ